MNAKIIANNLTEEIIVEKISQERKRRILTKRETMKEPMI